MKLGITFVLNDRVVETDLPPLTPVLDYLRASGFKGVKEGCHEGECGACMVLHGRLVGGQVSYRAVTSCLLPLGEIAGDHLVTIEGLNQETLTPIQELIADEGATQCGFCTPGIVLALTGFLLASPNLGETEAIAAVEGNICRCTGYTAVRRVLTELCRKLGESLPATADRLPALIRAGVVPPYFATIGDLLKGLPPPGREAKPRSGQPVIAGATDLFVSRPDKLRHQQPWFVSNHGHDRIWSTASRVYIGAAATVEQIRTSTRLGEAIPGLARFGALFGARPIRERATVAGNVVNASPIADFAIILLALDAEVGLVHDASRRTVPLRRFFKGYKELDLGPGEFIEWFRFPVRIGLAFNFEKVSKRRHLDIASVNTAIALSRGEHGRLGEVHLAAGGVAAVPLYLAATSQYLSGSVLAAATLDEATAIAGEEISPISDVRGTAEYKRLLLGQLIRAHFDVLFAEAELP